MNKNTSIMGTSIDPAIEAAVEELLVSNTLEHVWADIQELVDQIKPDVVRSIENARFFLTLLAIEDRARRGTVFFFAAARKRLLLRAFLLKVGVCAIGPKGTYVSWPLRGALKAGDAELCLRLLELGHRPGVVRRLLKDDEKALLADVVEARTAAIRLQALLPRATEPARQRF